MQSASENLENLLRRSSGRLWRGRSGTTGRESALSTGYPALDELLPGNGWPLGAVTELLLAEPANGELGLMLSAMRTFSADQRWLTWISSPAVPYAPALAQAGINLQRSLWLPDMEPKSAWWAAEQLAQHSRSGLIMAWLEPLNRHAIRRLQLAVETGGGMLVLCRHARAQKQTSAAALRVILAPQKNAIELTIIKSRGNLRQQSIILA